MSPARPVRTCVGCRERAEKPGLLRVVAGEDGALRPDVRGRERTRGAYLCPRFACVEQALKRGGLARSFKRAVRPSDPRDLARLLAAALLSEARREAEIGRRLLGPRGSGIELGELGPISGEERAWRIAGRVRQAEELQAEAESAVLEQRQSKGTKRAGQGATPKAPRSVQGEGI